MKSQRLPGKVLMNLPFGSNKTILGRIIDTLNKTDFDIIVATSQNSENDRIEDFCSQSKINCFRGDENNVFSRYVTIQKEHNYDIIVRLTADNPFIDNNFINKTLAYHLENKLDYTYTKGLPLGMNIEVINGHSLLSSQKFTISEEDKEHVTLALKRENKYKKAIYDTEMALEKYRLTVDTVHDFLVANIVATISDDINLQGVDLIQYVRKNFEWIFSGNSSIIQKNATVNKTEEIKEATKLLSKLEYNFTANLLAENIAK